MIVIHSKFVSAMQGFWDNEVLLQAGYDVTRGASADSERATMTSW